MRALVRALLPVPHSTIFLPFFQDRFIFHPEDGGSSLLRKLCNDLWNYEYMTLHDIPEFEIEKKNIRK
jgi:hypothetical protein